MPLKEACRKFFYCLSRQKVLLFDEVKSTKLKACLGTFDLTAIGVGATFGSGIYVLTGQVAKTQAGPAVVISFLIAAIASLLSGLCYIEFATRVPKAGSAYVYTYLTIGEFPAFVTGWNMLFEYSIGAAVVARAFSVYVDSLTGGVIANATTKAIGELNIYGFSANLDFISFGIVILFTILLSTGVKNSSSFNNILTAFNLLIAATIIVAGLFFVKGENWSNFAPFGAHGVIAGASTCFYAFIGFDIIATTAEEARNPGKSLPLSIIGTILICFLTYFAVSSVVTLMVPYQELHVQTAVSDAFGQNGANWAKYLVGCGAGLSMLCCTLVSMFPLPRMLYAMSQDGLLIKSLSRVLPGSGTPIVSTIVAGVFTAFIALLLDLDQLVEMLSIGTLLAYTMVVICVLKLRYQIDSVSSPSYVTSDDDSAQNEDDQIKEQPSPTRKGSRYTGSIIACIALDVLALCSLLVFGTHIYKAAFYTMLSLLIVLLLACVIFLSLQPQSERVLVFRTPFVPFLPIAAFFCNIYLMMELRKLTWLRMLVWLFIGLVVYFVYGIRHSIAGNGFHTDEEKSALLSIVHKTPGEKSDKSE